MDWLEYQNWVMGKLRKDLTPLELMQNMALGVAGEAGEACTLALSLADSIKTTALKLAAAAGNCADQVKKHAFHGKVLDTDKLTNETGDVLFYAAALAGLLGVQLTDVVQANIFKLDARYPEGFDPTRAHAAGETPAEEIEAAKAA